jgi:hypothetical protein
VRKGERKESGGFENKKILLTNQKKKTVQIRFLCPAAKKDNFVGKNNCQVVKNPNSFFKIAKSKKNRKI